MTKVKYYINVETPHTLNNEQKMEILADIRNAIRNVRFNLPDIKVVVGRELSIEDIAEEISKPSTDSQSREDCVHYDEAQGRHKCVNPVVKMTRCLGVCRNYEDK